MASIISTVGLIYALSELQFFVGIPFTANRADVYSRLDYCRVSPNSGSLRVQAIYWFDEVI
jgi:hypothetical protein